MPSAWRDFFAELVASAGLHRLAHESGAIDIASTSVRLDSSSWSFSIVLQTGGGLVKMALPWRPEATVDATDNLIEVRGVTKTFGS